MARHGGLGETLCVQAGFGMLRRSRLVGAVRGGVSQGSAINNRAGLNGPAFFV